jgi:uncharacterized protein YcnI
VSRLVRALLATAALLAVAAPAAAHVDVLPTTVTQGEATEFTARVPSERDLPTTRVRLDVPEQVTVYSLGEPPRGWDVTPIRGADGRIRSIVWGGGSIPPERYADFTFLGTAFGEGEAVWPARQTYADGQVKPWTGPPETEGAVESGPGDPGPAARVTIAAEGAAPATGGSTSSSSSSSSDDSGVGIWLGVIAIAIAALAMLAVGFLWSTRPLTLPGDEEPPR